MKAAIADGGISMFFLPSVFELVDGMHFLLTEKGNGVIIVCMLTKKKWYMENLFLLKDAMCKKDISRRRGKKNGN